MLDRLSLAGPALAVDVLDLALGGVRGALGGERDGVARALVADEDLAATGGPRAVAVLECLSVICAMVKVRMDVSGDRRFTQLEDLSWNRRRSTSTAPAATPRAPATSPT